MATDPIRFDDGAAYEIFMGKWSQLVANTFLDWLSPPPGLRWLDVGCGNGAFTENIFRRCGPSLVHGIDPSEGALNYARSRSTTRTATFQKADAMALPFADRSFDVAVMPLVIFFVPEPAKGVAEMARVVSPGGHIAAYAWDMPGGGFPYAALREEMQGLGIEVSLPPSPDASRIDVLHQLWTSAGLDTVETTTITVQRTFADFNDYWQAVLGGPSVCASLGKASAETVTRLQEQLKARLSTDAGGHITYSARANAVKGRRQSDR